MENEVRANVPATAKEYFEQAFMVESLILEKRQLLQKYRGREQKGTVSCFTMSGFGGYGARRSVDAAADTRTELIAKLEREIEQLKKQPEEMYLVIRKLENPKHRFVLENYYLLKERTEDIARALNVTPRRCNQIRQTALEASEKLLPFEWKPGTGGSGAFPARQGRTALPHTDDGNDLLF